MLRSIPFIVQFIFIALIGVELLLFAGLIRALYQSPLPVAELAIFGLLIAVISLMLLFGFWLAYNQRRLPNVPIHKRATSSPATNQQTITKAAVEA